MAVPKCKKSKMKKRIRKAAKRYQGVEVNRCSVCDEPNMPHRACSSCGHYKGKQVLTISEE